MPCRRRSRRFLEAMAEKQVTNGGRHASAPGSVRRSRHGEPNRARRRYSRSPRRSSTGSRSRRRSGYPILDQEVQIVLEQRHSASARIPWNRGREAPRSFSRYEPAVGARLPRPADSALARRARAGDARKSMRSPSVPRSRASLALERGPCLGPHSRTLVRRPRRCDPLFIPVVAHRLVFEPFTLAAHGGLSYSDSLLEQVRVAFLNSLPCPSRNGPAAKLCLDGRAADQARISSFLTFADAVPPVQCRLVSRLGWLRAEVGSRRSRRRRQATGAVGVKRGV